MAVEILNDEPEENQIEHVVESAPAPEVKVDAPAPAPVVDEVPDKYKGKSISDIVKMHSEAETLLGRQSGEIGELRRLTDEFIRPKAKSETGSLTAPTESNDDDSEFFVNPKSAINKAVENHPLVKELRSRNAESQQERAQRAFSEKHPDHKEVVMDPEFRAYVEKSPVRMELIKRANTEYDVDAADEVFSTWKELKALRNPTKTEAVVADKAVDEAARLEAVRAGKVPSGNAIPGSGNGGKPIFRRADLIRMRMNDPARYEEMGDEITAAYLENRVK